MRCFSIRKEGKPSMKKLIMLLVMLLVLALSGCSLLPEDSPILEGEYAEMSGSANSGKKKKKNNQESTEESVEVSTEEASQEESTQPSTEETKETSDEPSEEIRYALEKDWTELPEGGEANPIIERESRDKVILVVEDGQEPETPETEEYSELSGEKKPKPQTTKQPTGEEEEEELPQELQSYLTGEWKDLEVVNRRSIAVMFPNGYRAGSANNSPRLKLYGISKASVIYEAPVEGRITALMGVFEDYDSLDKLGPVVSARDYFIYHAMSTDSIFIHDGLVRMGTEELVNTDRVDAISAPAAGVIDGVKDVFYSIETIIPDAGKGYTDYFDVTKLKETIEAKEYETEHRETFEQGFLFANDSLATYPNAPNVKKIWPGGKVKNNGGYGNFANMNPYFEYDKDHHLYYRYQFGELMVDGMNNKKMGVTNVVLKICHGEERTPDQPKLDYLAFRVHGEGECYVFTNGKMIHGTWRKNSDTSADYLYDEEGNEIVLNQGKTWVCCVWQEYQDFILME